MRLRIDLPYGRPPLSLNDRMHWAAKATATKRLRAECELAARVRRRDAETPRLPLRVTLVWRVKDRRRRDADNRYATLKPCIDGIADAFGIDDNHNNVAPAVAIEYAPGERPGVWLDVRDADEPPYDGAGW